MRGVLLIPLFYCDRRLPATPLQMIDMMKRFELDKVHEAKHRSDSAKIRPCNKNVYLPTCLLMFIKAQLATVLVHVHSYQTLFANSSASMSDGAIPTFHGAFLQDGRDVQADTASSCLFISVTLYVFTDFPSTMQHWYLAHSSAIQ